MARMTSIHQATLKGPIIQGSGVTIRRYEREDNEALLDCLTDGNENWPPFGTSCSGIDYIDWKFSDNHLGPSLSCLAEVNGRVLAFLGSTAAMVCIGERRYLAYHYVDMYTRPEARGIGLMGKVFDYHQKEIDKSGCQFSYGFPNASSHSIMRERGYLDLPAQMIEFQNIVDPKSFFGGRLALLKTTGYQMYQRLKATTMIGDENLKEDRSPRFDARANELFEHAAKDFGFVVVRNHDYLNWRYADPRSGNFIVRQFRKRGRLVGYFVLKVIDRQCYLADLLVDPEHLSALDTMLGTAKDVARVNGANIIFCRLPGEHTYSEALKASGFALQADHGALGDPKVIYRTDNEDIRRVVEDDGTLCHLTFGDTDWV